MPGYAHTQSPVFPTHPCRPRRASHAARFRIESQKTECTSTSAGTTAGCRPDADDEFDIDGSGTESGTVVEPETEP